MYSSRLIVGVRTPTDDPAKPFVNVHVGAPAVDIHLRTGIGLGKLIVGLFTSPEGLNMSKLEFTRNFKGGVFDGELINKNVGFESLLTPLPRALKLVLP